MNVVSGLPKVGRIPHPQPGLLLHLYSVVTTLFVYTSFKHPIKIGVRIACGNSQGNHQLQTCLQSRSFGPAKGRANPSSPSQENNFIIYSCYIAICNKPDLGNLYIARFILAGSDPAEYWKYIHVLVILRTY